jgi:hypothetical protein
MIEFKRLVKITEQRDLLQEGRDSEVAAQPVEVGDSERD